MHSLLDRLIPCRFMDMNIMDHALELLLLH